MITRREVLKSGALSLITIGLPDRAFGQATQPDRSAADFLHPPDAAKPWVYWFFMDGNLTQEGMTADLEALQQAGVGGAIYMEVGIGVERGPVEFMSAQWQDLLGHAFREADRLGLQIALAAGPGWCGTGGPWVKPEQSMQHLVFSETSVHGPIAFDALLPQPKPRTPFFGEETLPPDLHKLWKEFYLDVLVLAFPTVAKGARIGAVDEKALYTRGSYSSQIPGPYSNLPNVRPFFQDDEFGKTPAAQCIASSLVIDVTNKLDKNGRLVWNVPAGDWTVMRFGRTITGQTTRPAPAPGLGLESDKFDQEAIDTHFEAYVGSLLKKTGEPKHAGRGLTTLHFDSWEMSSQNWSANFREEFTRRRGYDPSPWLPTFAGHVVDSPELSERFLWDIRETAQELVVEKHIRRLQELGRQHGLQLSLEPYDLNPCADLTLGSIADIPMGEFWSLGWDVKTDFSITEAASLGHTLGRPIIAAEAFTARMEERGQQYPGSMKAQGDWAFCSGINRFVIHRYQSQPWMNRYPGMTMGPNGGYGVHWERTQTWWGMSSAYHLYLTRCQQMLRRGLFVADILYVALEGAPNVFLPPGSATRPGEMRDRRGYNFDGCAPGTLIERASVKDGRIVFPDGMSYQLLVLPRSESMTLPLLKKIAQLAEGGATILGAPPRHSPSLQHYPQCDQQIENLAGTLWGQTAEESRSIGKGRIHYDSGALNRKSNPSERDETYPSYAVTETILSQMGVKPDFEAGDSIRYIHRREGDDDLYFIANAENKAFEVTARFRVTGKQPEWWDPLGGTTCDLPEFQQQDGMTAVPIRLDALQSGFVVFRKPAGSIRQTGQNFPRRRVLTTLTAAWEVSFDPKWGGPEKVVFGSLDDWATSKEPGIRYYSGTARYETSFAFPEAVPEGMYSLSLGKVRNIARILLNEHDLGIVWCDPWRLEIPPGLLKKQANKLSIDVANLWINRLIGDSGLPPEKRYTWATSNPFHPDSPLQQSGLLGPVEIQTPS